MANIDKATFDKLLRIRSSAIFEFKKQQNKNQ